MYVYTNVPSEGWEALGHSTYVHVHVQVDYPPTQFVIGERDRDRENKMALTMGSNPHWLVAKELLCQQARLPMPCTRTCTCVVYMHFKWSQHYIVYTPCTYM